MEGSRRAQAPRRSYRLLCAGREVRLGERTIIMGVLNVTPDSFSDGGLYDASVESSVLRMEEMEHLGADIIDIGGESTRPGSEGVSAETEAARVMPVIEAARKRVAVPISIDTTKAVIAREALERGASIVNDISGLAGDSEMASVVARNGAGLVLMHMRGSPQTMQDDTQYDDLVADIRKSLSGSVAIALAHGISREQIVLDPGIGFGKSVAANLEIIARLGELKSLGFPLLVGASRKSFIGSILDRPVGERLMGTAAACAALIMNGADMIRVHDVREMRDVARFTDALVGKGRSL